MTEGASPDRDATPVEQHLANALNDVSVQLGHALRDLALQKQTVVSLMSHTKALETRAAKAEEALADGPKGTDGSELSETDDG